MIIKMTIEVKVDDEMFPLNDDQMEWTSIPISAYKCYKNRKAGCGYFQG